jgi:hypothetical protein
VVPIVHSGVRDEPLKAPSNEGLPPGVYVVATRVTAGECLWLAK